MIDKAIISYIVIFMTIYLTSVPWGYVIGYINGIDITKHGSCNIGATNVRRVLGKNCGRLCFILDFLKGLLPVLIVMRLVAIGTIPKEADLAVVISAFAAFAGHVWSVYLKFKGGKGIATTAGILLGIAPFSLLTALIVWIGVFFASRYVSLASIAAALILPVSALVYSLTHIYTLKEPTLVLLLLLGLLAVWRHKDNIRRLANGTENRFVKATCNNSENQQESSDVKNHNSK